MRQLSIRLRLLGGFLLIGVVLLTIVLLGVLGYRTQERAAATNAEELVLMQDVLAVKYQAADWNGWQTAYALDAALNTPDPTSHRSFEVATAALNDGMRKLSGDAGLTDANRADLERARTSIEAFMALDARIWSAYQSGDAAAVKAAHALVLGEEIKNYQNVADAVGHLADDIAVRAAAASKAAQEAASRGRTQMITAGVLAALFLLVFVPLLLSSIQRPLSELRLRLADIADGEGDLTLTAPVAGNDELTSIASSFNRFLAKIVGTVRAVDESANSLAAASEQMSANAAQIAATADEASARAGVVAGASEELSSNIQTVAAGSEQMSASIREIATSASQAATVADQAVTAVEGTNTTVLQLGTSSAEIGNVVKVITAIAEQTNLLALNATIEAARAGEYGKGFAVVASEVKELAQETGRATEDISRRVQAIQADTGNAVDAIGHIAEIIGRISDYQLTISTAVEQQAATTAEMSRNVTEAAAGSGEIASNITGVATAANVTNESVTQAKVAIAELSRMSSDLQQMIGQFRY
ncbi:MAG TPA: methyl-accepting chemotaxis protein [Catenuloplanes sp.]|jgi:methyl-accepting chemotaxis protein